MSDYSEFQEKVDRKLHFSVPIGFILVGVALVPLLMLLQGSFEFSGLVWLSVIPMALGVLRLFWRW